MVDPFCLGRVAVARVARHERWFAAHWLTARERAFADGLGVAKRRVEWIAGRVAARRALVAAGAPRTLDVLPAAGARDGAPAALDALGRVAPLALSISHAAGWAVAAASATVRVGVDVEAVERRHPSFAAEAFAPGELDAWAAALGLPIDGAQLETLAWCAKEALLKLAGSGLRAALPAMVPRALEITGCDGALDTAELGRCQFRFELSRRRAMVVAWIGREEERA